MMDENEIQKLAESLHPLERKVLPLFQGEAAVSEEDLLRRDPSIQPSQLSMALGWLLTKEVLKVVEERRQEFVLLTEVGRSYAAQKNPVLRLAEEIRQRGQVPIRELQQRTDLEAEEKSAAIGALKETAAVRVIPGGLLELADPSKLAEFEQLQATIERLNEHTEETEIAALSSEDQATIAAYHRKRSKSKGVFRVSERVSRSYAPTERFGPLSQQAQSSGGAEEIGTLTPEMLKEGSWRGKRFRKYNIQLPPPRIVGGRKHPYRSFLDQVKEKFVSMGFEEMRGPLVENEFWDMDALYMPQFHPAREIHDVYFVDGVDRSIPDDVIGRVAAAHQNGGETGSRGWRYPFDVQRTRRLILRSQGTAVSARTLGAGAKVPGKYFSIARCFRYDQVDATHAPDFFQVEGIVLGEEIHFRTLLGLLTLFAKEIARAEEIKFLPAYFPFTEPSVEMHVRHPKLGWMELGGAGLFRPELRSPLGVDVPVIAWGLGLDRMAMVALGISDIRDLFSPDLGFIREKRIVQEGVG